MSLFVDIHKQLNHFSLNVTFSIDDDVLAIFGASGSGKSMILKCIAGIETPDSGKIVLNGQTLFDSKKRINLPCQKRQVGYLFQNYALFHHMTVLENVMVSEKITKNEALELLTRFNLEGLENQLPNELSGGQQQRVAICRMLASRPELLLFDEPFSAIDSFLKDQLHMTLLELIKEFQKNVCVVTHDFSEAYHLCQSIIFIEKGQLLAQDSLKHLYEHPRCYQIAHLLGYKNIVNIKENKIVPWGYFLSIHYPSLQVCIPTTAFQMTIDKNKTIAYKRYQIINDFQNVEVVFIGDYGKIWASFTQKEWQQRPKEPFYLKLDENAIIPLDN